MKQKKIKNKLVSDYILDFLVSKGVKHVFLLTGGAIAFLIDAFSRRKDIKYIAVAHEQSAAMMADAYSRVGPNFGATMSTSGPGATNLITGICCSWFDSIPTLHITGQVNTYENINSYKTIKKVRQIGFQETDISLIAKSITKYSKIITNPNKIDFDLKKSYDISQSGRQGPVLIDIPMNFQRINLSDLNFQKYKKKNNSFVDNYKVNKQIDSILKKIKQSKRPIILIGGGVRLGDAVNEMNTLIKKLNIPVVSTWTGLDCIAANNKNFMGPIGVYGRRYSNFAIQNSDFLISIGARLDTRVTGGKPATFARQAYKVVVDIDKGELLKRRGLKPDIAICSHSKIFLKLFIKKIKNINFIDRNINEWKFKCIHWKQTYPIIKKKYLKQKNNVNPYIFFDKLSDKLTKKDTLIADTGAHLTWFMQSFRVKLGQRVISAFGNSPMGYAFPAAIGASLAKNSKQIISINGEGSFQINIQELQTLKFLKLPVKIFILNNKGYGIIKQFQSQYLNHRYEATSKGYSSPNFEKVSKAYGIKYYRIEKNKDINNNLVNILSNNLPCLCEILIEPNQQIEPKLEFGKPIEDLTPLLNRSEFNNNMLIPKIDDKLIK
tara:strand:- start:640 stop:2460 length:1821 start_codon:yes stop_codon:yes gene_type:complete